ncbi:hypothetical protein ZIOFF_062237 [Zingiber officinale]|uniref:Uncharacterized protein n=1 Tax=Zingiber officinale TaxID=94328 RepID=A0A8J5F575_ZINOF|nr:hypothetical protein ZIOFF_062237 [Zingiber officinale]
MTGATYPLKHILEEATPMGSVLVSANVPNGRETQELVAIGENWDVNEAIDKEQEIVERHREETNPLHHPTSAQYLNLTLVFLTHHFSRPFLKFADSTLRTGSATELSTEDRNSGQAAPHVGELEGNGEETIDHHIGDGTTQRRGRRPKEREASSFPYECARSVSVLDSEIGLEMWVSFEARRYLTLTLVFLTHHFSRPFLKFVDSTLRTGSATELSTEDRNSGQAAPHVGELEGNGEETIDHHIGDGTTQRRGRRPKEREASSFPYECARSVRFHWGFSWFESQGFCVLSPRSVLVGRLVDGVRSDLGFLWSSSVLTLAMSSTLKQEGEDDFQVMPEDLRTE